jgi:signal transduction histidine kinase/ActR/RegA family two-component response regulator
MLGLGAATMAVGDAIYTTRIFDGMIAWPPVLAAAWTTAVVAMAAAALLDSQPEGPPLARRWSLVSVPITAALVAIFISLLHVERTDIAVYLSTAVLVLAVARLAMSLIDNQRAEERRRREDEIRREREEAERANRAKTQFLSRMSHEVRTPLNSILGFAQLLVDDVHGADRASVERILRAGNHLRQLIDDIMDLSAIEAGETVVTLEPVALGPVIEESVALLEPLARRTSTGIVRHDADDAPAAVVADDQRLRQVLLNLISNAVKYGGAESEVVVRIEPDGDRARINVIDSGPGIPDEHVPQLFQPFERGSARGSGIEGNGLGLALTKNLIETMNGSIGFDTSPSGSTFWVTLPAADRVGAKQAARLPAAPVVPVEGTRTALYIEDHASNIALVERLLARRGDFQLVTAMTGRAGLKLAAAVRPDVVLLDLDLPDMRGEDVLAELRVESSTREIPVIVVSADATAARQEALLEEGADAYIVKPIQLASFMATLDSVVGAPAG